MFTIHTSNIACDEKIGKELKLSRETGSKALLYSTEVAYWPQSSILGYHHHGNIIHFQWLCYTKVYIYNDCVSHCGWTSWTVSASKVISFWCSKQAINWCLASSSNHCDIIMPLSIALMPLHTHHLGNMIAIHQVVNVHKSLALAWVGVKLQSDKRESDCTKSNTST